MKLEREVKLLKVLSRGENKNKNKYEELRRVKKREINKMKRVYKM